MDFILAEETRNEVAEFMEKVEQCGKWPEQVCTTMFFLILKDITSERPIALMPTMIRWCEALRASEMEKWHYKHRIDWDTRDRRNGGGAQRTVCEILWEMEKFKCPEGQYLGVWATHSHFPKKILRGALRVLRASAACSCGGATPDHRLFKMELLVSTYCGKQRRQEESDNFLQVSGRKVARVQQMKRGGYERKCGNARSGPGNTNQAAGSERNGEEKKVRCEILRKIGSSRRISCRSR